MILALNTAQTQHELALLNENPASPGEYELIAEKIWLDEHQDVDYLVPFLQGLLEEAGLNKSDLTALVVVKGPAPFTSLRMGIAFANALAEGLEIPLYGISTFELLRRKAATTDSTLVLLHAGRMDVGLQHNDEAVQVGPMAPLLKDFPHDHGIHVIAELPEALREELHPIMLEKNWIAVEGHELQSMGEMLMTFGLSGLKPVTTVEPVYLKGPHITVSADPWKK